MVKLSIQLVNYNTKKYLIECLDGLFKDLKGFPYAYEILILENNSKDNLSDLEKKYQGKISFFHSKNNLGYGGGHNFLSNQANGEYLLFLNADIKFLEPETINRLLDTLKDKNVQVVGPQLINKDNETQEYDHGEIKGIKAKIAINSCETLWLKRQVLSQVAWVSGAVLLVTKKCFEKAGKFDENYFLYKEEEDLCLRIRKQEGVILYDPSIKVFHYGSVVANKSEYMEISKSYFTKKNISKVKYTFSRLLYRIIF